jgi:hypothetical protein
VCCVWTVETPCCVPAIQYVRLSRILCEGTPRVFLQKGCVEGVSCAVCGQWTPCCVPAICLPLSTMNAQGVSEKMCVCGWKGVKYVQTGVSCAVCGHPAVQHECVSRILCECPVLGVFAKRVCGGGVVCCVWTVDTLLCSSNMSACLASSVNGRPGCFCKKGVWRGCGVLCVDSGHPAVFQQYVRLSRILCERTGCFCKKVCGRVVRNDEGVSCSVCGHSAVVPVSLTTSEKAQGVCEKMCVCGWKGVKYVQTGVSCVVCGHPAVQHECVSRILCERSGCYCKKGVWRGCGVLCVDSGHPAVFQQYVCLSRILCERPGCFCKKGVWRGL